MKTFTLSNKWIIELLLDFFHGQCTYIKKQLFTCGAACSVAVKLLDLDPQRQGFDPWCGQGKICTAVGPLSKVLNPTLLQGYVSCLV